MTEEPDLDKLIAQLGLGWTKFAKRATGFLKVLITHATTGDEHQTLQSLSAFYESMDFGKLPGDVSHLFVTACELLSSKHLLPSKLVPIGALKGSELEGVRYLVFTSVGAASKSEVHFYSTETTFEVSEGTSTFAKSPNPSLGRLSALAKPSLSTHAGTIRLSDPEWEMSALFDLSKIESVRRLVVTLSTLVDQLRPTSRPGDSTDVIDQLEKAKQLYASGVIDDGEFERVKSKIIGTD